MQTHNLIMDYLQYYNICSTQLNQQSQLLSMLLFCDIPRSPKSRKKLSGPFQHHQSPMYTCDPVDFSPNSDRLVVWLHCRLLELSWQKGVNGELSGERDRAKRVQIILHPIDFFDRFK